MAVNRGEARAKPIHLISLAMWSARGLGKDVIFVDTSNREGVGFSSSRTPFPSCRIRRKNWRFLDVERPSRAGEVAERALWIDDSTKRPRCSSVRCSSATSWLTSGNVAFTASCNSKRRDDPRRVLGGSHSQARKILSIDLPLASSSSSLSR